MACRRERATAELAWGSDEAQQSVFSAFVRWAAFPPQAQDVRRRRLEAAAPHEARRRDVVEDIWHEG